MIKITLPDGSVREYTKGITALEIATSISEGLARNILAAEVDGKVVDVTLPINQDSHLKLLKWEDDAGKSTLWHSSAHLMAEVLEAKFPGIKFGIGPPIENGFYYDVDMNGQFISDNDFKEIETKILEAARRNVPYIRSEVSKADAIDYFTKKGDEYKLDLLQNLEDGSITFYQQGTVRAP
jgi:threonyl-tRNA synthetase